MKVEVFENVLRRATTVLVLGVQHAASLRLLDRAPDQSPRSGVTSSTCNSPGVTPVCGGP
eukprot:m.95707 g.95707  ORF g.95707 m.95707 type:complete len:60 (+) comp12338_c0_seq1:1357-1536(+)